MRDWGSQLQSIVQLYCFLAVIPRWKLEYQNLPFVHKLPWSPMTLCCFPHAYAQTIQKPLYTKSRRDLEQQQNFWNAEPRPFNRSHLWDPLHTVWAPHHCFITQVTEEKAIYSRWSQHSPPSSDRCLHWLHGLSRGLKIHPDVCVRMLRPTLLKKQNWKQPQHELKRERKSVDSHRRDNRWQRRWSNCRYNHQ